MRADLMRLLHFVAVGAFRQRGLDQKIMGAPGAGAPLGMPAFWVRHSTTPSSDLIWSDCNGLSARKPIVFSASPASGAPVARVAGLSNESRSGTLRGSNLRHNWGKVRGNRCGKSPSSAKPTEPVHEVHPPGTTLPLEKIQSQRRRLSAVPLPDVLRAVKGYRTDQKTGG